MPKNPLTRGNVRSVKKTKNVSKRTKTVTAANNHIRLVRTYRHCGGCRDNGFPVDNSIGSGSGYTDGAKRLITYAAGTSSYRHAADMLKEFGCFHLPHQTVGGNEWREMKVAIITKRERGESALPEDWDSQDLPKPTVNMAMATLDKIDDFTLRCKAFRFNLGVGSGVSVLGDGAKWIWNLSEHLFGNTAECLDVFHALEHISQCGKILYKDAKEFQQWFEEMRLVLLHGFCGHR